MSDDVEITVNGASVPIPRGSTVSALVTHLGLEGPVAVEINREIVVRAEHGARVVEAGDVVEIVHFVGGG